MSKKLRWNGDFIELPICKESREAACSSIVPKTELFWVRADNIVLILPLETGYNKATGVEEEPRCRISTDSITQSEVVVFIPMAADDLLKQLKEGGK